MNHAPARVRQAAAAGPPHWVAMRRRSCADCGVDPAVLRELLDGPGSVVLLAGDPGGQVLDLAEVRLRHDYVNGTAGSPVGLLESGCVQPAARRCGVSGGLVAECGRRVRGQCCPRLVPDRLALDMVQDDAATPPAHAACGLSETGWRVYCCMDPEAP